MAALEVLKTVKKTESGSRSMLEAMDFTDEEGTHLSLFGSARWLRHLNPEDLKKPRAADVIIFLAGMARAGLTEASLLSASATKGFAGGIFGVAHRTRQTA
jgi:hypothetical protein